MGGGALLPHGPGQETDPDKQEVADCHPDQDNFSLCPVHVGGDSDGASDHQALLDQWRLSAVRRGGARCPSSDIRTCVDSDPC